MSEISYPATLPLRQLDRIETAWWMHQIVVPLVIMEKFAGEGAGEIMKLGVVFRFLHPVTRQWERRTVEAEIPNHPLTSFALRMLFRTMKAQCRMLAAREVLGNAEFNPYTVSQVH